MEPIILAPVGRLDMAGVPRFEAELMRAIDGGAARLLIDLAGLDYIASAGLRVMLIGAKKMWAGGGRLALCGLQPSVFDVFEISGFTAILDIQPDRTAGLAALS